MARLAMRVKEIKRKKMTAKHAVKRAELRKKCIDTKISDEEREQARIAIQKLPKIRQKKDNVIVAHSLVAPVVSSAISVFAETSSVASQAMAKSRA